MEITTGTIVKSLAGHDKEEVFFILREEGEYVYLVDGKYRTLDKPKKKNRSMWRPFPARWTVRVKRSGKTRESPMKRSLVSSNVSKD